MEDLVRQVLAGKRYALSQILTHIENGTTNGHQAVSALFPHSGRAYLIGVTGAPGTGKSSLVNKLVLELRSKYPDQKIAIIAVDPTSPFTGGAVLGDRIRMRELAGDKNIFIRSMASRGNLGGLARATNDIVLAFDAAGYDFVVIETVGAGQSEVDIAKLAHSTLVVEAPGLGDDIQAIKSGIMEIGDILVVNKADKQGAEHTVKVLESMLEMGNHNADWLVPVCKTISTQGEGIVELVEKIREHKQYLETSQKRKIIDQKRLELDLLDTIRERLFADWQHQTEDKNFLMILDKVTKRELSPSQAAKFMVEENRE